MGILLSLNFCRFVGWQLISSQGPCFGFYKESSKIYFHPPPLSSFLCHPFVRQAVGEGGGAPGNREPNIIIPYILILVYVLHNTVHLFCEVYSSFSISIES